MNSNNSESAIRHLQPIDMADKYPKPLPLMGSMESPAFPIEALPDVVKEAVLEVHSFIQAPLPLIVSCALGVLASVAQGIVLVRRDRALIGPVSLILLTLAEPNERKSAVEKMLTTAIRDWSKQQQIEAANAWSEYKAAMVVFEAIESQLHRDIKSADIGSPEIESLQVELATHLKEKRPRKPLTTSIIQQDATKEGSIKHLSEKYPLVSILTAEGGTVFGGNSLNQSSIVAPLAFFNSLWSGESYSVTRSGDGETTLDDVALSMSVAVQPDVIDKFLDKSDQMARGIGFIARSLICFPETTQGFRPYVAAPEELPAVEAFNTAIGELLRILPEHIVNGRLKRKVINLSGDAKSVWIDYYNKIEAEHRKGGSFEFVRDVAGKSADNAARLAGLFHLIDSPDPAIIAPEISREHMEAGADVAAYYLQEAKRYLSSTDLPEDIRLAQWVSERLASYCRDRKARPCGITNGLMFNEITKRDIQRLGGAKFKKLTSINPLLEELLDANHLIDHREGARRNSVVFTINPRLMEAS